VALAASSYAALVGVAWLRYGRAATAHGPEADPLLDRFMPQYEVVERHHIRVFAPADATLAVAAETSLEQSPIVHAIFKARELLLGSTPGSRPHPAGLLAQMQSIGWGKLAERPGREIVMGAVTQPWLANVVFRPLPPDDFVDFNEPDFVKIVWTLRADAVSADETIFRTETRVATTGAAARKKFRWYWARFSPGIIVIRYAMLDALKREAERRARASRHASL
jgi:hypothetical protein